MADPRDVTLETDEEEVQRQIEEAYRELADAVRDGRIAAANQMIDEMSAHLDGVVEDAVFVLAERDVSAAKTVLETFETKHHLKGSFLRR